MLKSMYLCGYNNTSFLKTLYISSAQHGARIRYKPDTQQTKYPLTLDNLNNHKLKI